VFGHVVKPIKNTVFYLANDIFNCDAGALIAEIGTAFISSPGRIKSAVMGQHFKSDHFQLMKGIDQDVKDFIIVGGAYPASKIGKSCLTRDAFGSNACKLAV
jgi:hypothetical protein